MIGSRPRVTARLYAPRRRYLVSTLLVVFLAGACGADDGEQFEAGPTADAPYAVQVASYDVAADKPQRFLVGLVATEGGLIVGGSVEFDFEYLGGGAGDGPPLAPPISGVPGEFITVADGIEAEDGPRLRQGDEGVGVYEASDVTFGSPGPWKVTVTGAIKGCAPTTAHRPTRHQWCRRSRRDGHDVMAPDRPRFASAVGRYLLDGG